MPRTPHLHQVHSTVKARPSADQLLTALHLLSLLALVVTLLMFSVSPARATSNPDDSAPDGPAELAMFPAPQAPVTIMAGCDAGVVVFTVQNNTKRWSSRGHIRVADAQTGSVLRERQLALGERQKASFRVASADVQGGNYRVLVHMPEDEITYVKTFSGRCF